MTGLGSREACGVCGEAVRWQPMDAHLRRHWEDWRRRDAVVRRELGWWMRVGRAGAVTPRDREECQRLDREPATVAPLRPCPPCSDLTGPALLDHLVGHVMATRAATVDAALLLDGLVAAAAGDRSPIARMFPAPRKEEAPDGCQW